MYPPEMNIRTGSRIVVPKEFRSQPIFTPNASINTRETGQTSNSGQENRDNTPPLEVDAFRKKSDKLEEGNSEIPFALRYKPGRRSPLPSPPIFPFPSVYCLHFAISLPDLSLLRLFS